MKRHRVLVTAAAARDIADIHAYVAKQDGDRRASQLLDRIEAVLGKLAKLPLRGNHPKELAALGIHDYRETRVKPYRVTDRVIEDSVYVLLVVDGGRDMQSLLARRLLDD